MLILHKINKSIYRNILHNRSFLHAMSSFVDTRRPMSVPVLYGDEIAPPVRFVLMTASILNIEIEFRKIDLFKTENRSDFYKKINPLQKVPTIVIGDTKICDSHAISLYLCEIAKKQNLYPECPLLRAKINQILFFNASTLFRIDSEILSKFFAKQWPVSNKTIEEWYSALDFIEHHLDHSEWLSGNTMFLCDVCVVAVITSVIPLVPLTKRHQKVKKWITKFEPFEFYKINKRGLRILNKHIDATKKVLI